LSLLDRIVGALERIANAQTSAAWTHGDWIAAINVLVLFLTLAALVCYTIETKRLREATQLQNTKTGDLLKEAQQQNEISVMPILMLGQGRHERSPNKEVPLIRNLGKGPAFNAFTATMKIKDAEFSFRHVGTIGAGETYPVSVYTQDASCLDATQFWGVLFHGDTMATAETSIAYSGINDQKYRTIVRFKAGGHQIGHVRTVKE
jgi:hypothetical protein